MKLNVNPEKEVKNRFWSIAQRIVPKKEYESFCFQVIMGYQFMDDDLCKKYYNEILEVLNNELKVKP